MVRAPESPVLVTAASGTLRLSAWDASTRTLVDIGTIDAADAVGLTLSHFDWESAP